MKVAIALQNSSRVCGDTLNSRVCMAQCKSFENSDDFKKE